MSIRVRSRQAIVEALSYRPRMIWQIYKLCWTGSKCPKNNSHSARCFTFFPSTQLKPLSEWIRSTEPRLSKTALQSGLRPRPHESDWKKQYLTFNRTLDLKNNSMHISSVSRQITPNLRKNNKQTPLTFFGKAKYTKVISSDLCLVRNKEERNDVFCQYIISGFNDVNNLQKSYFGKFYS